MQRTRFGDMACSIARTLEVAGEPWSPLIIRDVWVGLTRFDEIQRDLGISRKVLTGRLTARRQDRPDLTLTRPRRQTSQSYTTLQAIRNWPRRAPLGDSPAGSPPDDRGL